MKEKSADLDAAEAYTVSKVGAYRDSIINDFLAGCAHKEKELEQLKKGAQALVEALEKIGHPKHYRDELTEQAKEQVARDALKTFNEKYGEKL